MTKLKKKLNILFHKIFLKLYSSMKNVTSEPMSLDLLREEVQILISTMIFIEFKLIFIVEIKNFGFSITILIKSLKIYSLIESKYFLEMYSFIDLSISF